MRRLFLFLATVSGLGVLLAAVQIAPRQVAPAIAQAIGAIQPRVSPDGQTIARTGGAMTRLTHDAGFDIEPTWSPEGEHIAYVNSPRFIAGDLRIVTKFGQPVNVPKRIEVMGTVVYQKIEWLPADRVFGVLRVDGQATGIGWVNWKTGETKTLALAPQWGRFAASADVQSVAFTTTPDQPGQQTGNDGVSAALSRDRDHRRSNDGREAGTRTLGGTTENWLALR